MRIRLKSLAAVIAFVLVTGSLVALTGLTFSRARLQDTARYSAVFSDAAGLREGVDVRASGVAVGTVREIELDAQGVKVTFVVPADLPLTESTSARIRYANLTGDRYLDLTPGRDPSAEPLAEGDTIPVEQTRPALDLDTLFAGFDPLMRALDADEANQLTSNLIAVTQGQTGAIETLLANVATFTSTLADRDALIGSTISDLAQALTTIDDRKAQVASLVHGLARLTRGLAGDRHAIGESLEGIQVIATDTARLLQRIRPDLKANVDQIGNVARELNRRSDDIIDVLELYPSTIQRLARGGAYGSFFNFFLCSVQVRVTLPNVPPIMTHNVESGLDRCVNKRR